MSFLSIFAAIIGTAERIVPIFVHNPKSNAIEAAAATTADDAIGAATQPGSPAINIAKTILGDATQIVPTLVHGKGGQLAAVILSSAEGTVQAMSQLQAATPPAAPPAEQG